VTAVINLRVLSPRNYLWDDEFVIYTPSKVCKISRHSIAKKTGLLTFVLRCLHFGLLGQ
jgi:hypothetical protein